MDHVNLSEMLGDTFIYEKKSRDSRSYVIYTLSNQPEIYEDLLFDSILKLIMRLKEQN